MILHKKQSAYGKTTIVHLKQQENQLEKQKSTLKYRGAKTNLIIYLIAKQLLDQLLEEIIVDAKKD